MTEDELDRADAEPEWMGMVASGDGFVWWQAQLVAPPFDPIEVSSEALRVVEGDDG